MLHYLQVGVTLSAIGHGRTYWVANSPEQLAQRRYTTETEEITSFLF
jgi:hypothetical protein